MNVEVPPREVDLEVEGTTRKEVRGGQVGADSPMIVIIVKNPDIRKRNVSTGRKNSKETDNAEDNVDGNMEAEK